MKVLLFANSDWYLYNFRLALAIRLRELKYEVILMSPIGAYVHRLEALGFHWVEAPMQRRSLAPAREGALILWLIRFIKTEGIDLVHGFTVKCAIYGGIAARLSGHRASVLAIAGLGYVFSSSSAKARLLRPCVLALLRYAAGGRRTSVIVQNSDDESLLTKHKVAPAHDIHLIRGSGVNCTKFTSSDAFHNNESVKILFASRLLWDKGLQEFIDAARVLKSAGMNLQFLLAGTPDEGNPNSADDRSVLAWVKEGLIHWLGHVDDMPLLMSSVDIFVLPTTYGEGVPRSLIEAAASKLALITTDVAGCREIVIHEKTGLLVPPKNAEALANSIRRLVENPAFARRLASEAQEKARAEFDEDHVLTETISIYGKLLSTL